MQVGSPDRMQVGDDRSRCIDHKSSAHPFTGQRFSVRMRRAITCHDLEHIGTVGQGGLGRSCKSGPRSCPSTSGSSSRQLHGRRRRTSGRRRCRHAPPSARSLRCGPSGRSTGQHLHRSVAPIGQLPRPRQGSSPVRWSRQASQSLQRRAHQAAPRHHPPQARHCAADSLPTPDRLRIPVLSLPSTERTVRRGSCLHRDRAAPSPLQPSSGLGTFPTRTNICAFPSSALTSTRPQREKPPASKTSLV